MTNESELRTYRAAPGLKSTGVPLVVPIMLLGLMAAAGVEGPFLLIWTVGIAVVMALCYVALRRSGTTVHHDHIEMRTPFRTRRVAWHEIQAIELTGSKMSGQFTLVRVASGRRLGLPHVNSRSVPSLPEEVRTLRELWERLRGPDWTPTQR